MIELKSTNRLLSSRGDLEKRGYIEHKDLSLYSSNLKTNIALLRDKLPLNRSIGAKQLSNHLSKDGVIDALLLQLDKETALYTKIEICNTLSQGNKKCATKMINFLGKIGNNQYQLLPEKVSKKKSYPLPRDIIARTLGNMNKNILTVLIHALKTTNIEQTRELIDAIGYLCFNQAINKERVFTILCDYSNHCDDPIIIWKIVRTYSVLLPASKQALEILLQQDDLLQLEAKRALAL